jgi:NADPH2:quinone reductase
VRALRFSRFGDPRDVLRLENLPMPEPGAGEVRVRFTHRPINPSDLLTVKGDYRIFAKPPLTPGLEGIGKIEALGGGVSGLEVGQRVISLTGMPGTWAEQLVLPAERAMPLPAAICDQLGAQTVANPMTAWALLYDELPLREGDWLLQTAAASTVGKMIATLARRRGVRTLNVVRRRDQAQAVRDAGGDVVVVTDEDSLIDRVRAVTGTDGVGVAIDAVGGSLGAQVVSCVRPGGVLYVYGLLSGNTLGSIDAKALIFDKVTVRGFWIMEWFQRQSPEVIGRGLTDVVTMLACGDLCAAVEAEYDLADFRQAIEHAERTGRRGKILLTG